MVLKSFFLTCLLFAAYLYFSFLNKGNITVNLPNGSYETTVPLVVVIALFTGALVVVVANFVGLGRSRLLAWRHGRRERLIRDAEENVRQGLASLRAGDLKRARFLLEKAHEKDPFSVVVYCALAELAEFEERSDDTIKYLGKALELDDRNYDVLFKLTEAYESKGDLKGAADVLSRILERDDSNRRAMAALRDIYRRQGGWREALEIQKKYLKLMPPEQVPGETERLAYLRYECARLSLALGIGEKAVQEIRDIIQEIPSFAPAHVTLAEALKAEGNVEEAADVLKKAFLNLRHPIFLIKLEDLYFSQEEPGKISALVNFYKRSVLETPNDFIIRLFYGKLCLRMVMVDEALEQFTTIAEHGGEFRSLHILLAEAYRRSGDLEQAAGEYRKALGIGKTHRLPFACKICGHEQVEWSSFCPSCGTWDSFVIHACETLDGITPPESFVFPA